MHLLELAVFVAAVEVDARAVVALFRSVTHAVAAHDAVAHVVARRRVGRLARLVTRRVGIDVAVAAPRRLADVAQADLFRATVGAIREPGAWIALSGRAVGG